jgi:serpin B
MHRLLVWLPCCLALLLSGCGAPAVGGELAKSSQARDTAPSIGGADSGALAAGNTEFALDLYQQLRTEDDNLFFSPYSISVAIAMTYAGARGQTERQVADALRYTLPQDTLHPAFNALDLELASRGEGARGRRGEPFRLHITNALWGQTGYSFLPEFLDLLAENYGAGMRLLDFSTRPEPSRTEINGWVADQTEQRIKDLIPSGVITTATRLVLTNAIYFDAAWESTFKKKATHAGEFRLLDGDEVRADMMHQSHRFPYAAGEGYQAIELPYDGGELSMVVLLPAEGRFAEFEESLDAEELAAILGDLAPTQVRLTMPRFKYGSAFRLKDALSAMGMADAFVRGVADLSGMDGTRSLFIQQVVHKALVRVDEEGTEAAAATAVAIALAAAPSQEVVEVVIDRPFIYLIRDLETGTILFLGRVLDPTA